MAFDPITAAKLGIIVPFLIRRIGYGSRWCPICGLGDRVVSGVC